MTLRGLSLCLLVAALAGCNNAYEQISVGRWRAMGAGPDFASVLAAETTQPGNGRTIGVGDLVSARLHVTVPDKPAMELPPQADIVWLWVGSDPPAEGAEGAAFGFLGSQELRTALVGRKLHEKFTLKTPGLQDATVSVPSRGFMVFMSQQPLLTDGTATVSPVWPAIDIDGRVAGTQVEIEILQICEAKLFHRTAYLQQWGVVFGWGDFKPPSVRAGTLGWSKLEARCPPPAGDLTLQVGPLYSGGQRNAGSLYEWRDSYRRLRPPGFFHEEWEGASLPD